MPHNSNNPDSIATNLHHAAKADALMTSFEVFIAEQWRLVLQHSRILKQQNFFQLGGSAQEAHQVTEEIGKKLGLYVPPSLLFDAPTLACYAEKIEQLVRLSHCSCGLSAKSPVFAKTSSEEDGGWEQGVF